MVALIVLVLPLTRPKPNTRVTISPIIGFKPLYVTVRASIDNPTEDWYCPELTVTWSDGTQAKRLSDCPTWDDEPDGYSYHETVHGLLGAGDHNITALLVQGKHSELFDLRVKVSE